MYISPEAVSRIFHQAYRLLLKAKVRPQRTLLQRILKPKVPATGHQRWLSIESPSRADGLSPATSSPTLNIHTPATVPSLRDRGNSPQLLPERTEHVPEPLPVTCPGCGALSQEVESEEAGFYTRSRKAVKGYLRQSKANRELEERELQRLQPDSEGSDRHVASEQNVLASEDQARSSGDNAAVVETAVVNELPVCDRCHDLIYNSRGVSISHPSIDSLAESISESPFRKNHIYHVLDAADFPMSLVPSIFRTLVLARPRTQNRRSQHSFSNKPTLSFIITRSDLLAPTKEMVDSRMTYFTSVLRKALGKFGQDMRLGNVHLVSAKRGWWSKDIKDSIWNRGGGNWMVGKVNVGKSNLFEVLFPKGSGERAPSYRELADAQDQPPESSADEKADANALLSETSLLPPPQPETPFPSLPLVSNLPGTTASPIRLPFGNHKGELIDLPGLERGHLEEFVRPEHKVDLVMTHRPTVVQHNIKHGQSLLLGGGLVRITPLLDSEDTSTIVLAYPFVPIDAHVTATEKAVGTQLQQRESGIKSILADGSGGKMASAGTFSLETDVTKSRAAPLFATGLRADRLPFRVYATDILIEGVGWVELVCQVRRRRVPVPSVDPQVYATTFVADEIGDALSHLDAPNKSPKKQSDAFSTLANDFEFPKVEIFTPEGKHIGKRESMDAWMMLNKRNTKQVRKATHGARPRRPMSGAKKRAKTAVL